MRRAAAASNLDQLDVRACGSHQEAQVTRIRRQELITIACEQGYCGVNHVNSLAARQQCTCATTKVSVERDHVDSSEKSCQIRLPATSASPNLSDHPPVGHRGSAGESLAFDQRDHVTIQSLDCDESTGVEYQHSVPPRRASPFAP
jgi:hypothetical protein